MLETKNFGSRPTDSLYRRHQQNHGDILYCKYPDCEKTFHRQDLLKRHEEKQYEMRSLKRMRRLTFRSVHGDASMLERSPSISYTSHSETPVHPTSGISHHGTPGYSPAPTQTPSTSQPQTPDPAAMSAPRYTVSQFNQFRSLSQSFTGPFLSPDAK